MIKNPYFAGLAAGGVAATLYLSIATGSAIGLLLFYIAPLPGFIAGFGWGTRAAVLAAISGTIVVAAALGSFPALTYVLTIALPGILFTHYAFLYRASSDDFNEKQELDGDQDQEEPTIEWYPIGHLIMIIALYGGLLSAITVLMLGTSLEAYIASTSSELDKMMESAKEAKLLKELSDDQMAKFKQFIQSILPASTAILWTLLILLNMWIAAHIVRKSELLYRPWPDFSSINYPPVFSFVFVGLFVLSFLLPDYPSLLLSGYTGALVLAFLIMGLAVAHFVTRSFPYRGTILFAIYIAVIFIGWGVPIFAVAGLIEPFLRLRQRIRAAPS